jgi:AcrB/AcrD/AcrF family
LVTIGHKASGGKGPAVVGSASTQARMKIERRASLETGDVTAEPVRNRRRSPSLWEASSKSTKQEHRGIGAGMWAKEGSVNTGSPRRRGARPQLEAREGQTASSRVADPALCAILLKNELGRLSTTFEPGTPQVGLELDREKARTLGVKVDSVYEALQAYLSGLYVNDIVRFGPVFKVFLQAEPEFTTQPDQIGRFYVRNRDGKMVPLDTLVDVRQIFRTEFPFTLQPLSCRRDHGRACTRLQLGTSSWRDRRSGQGHATGVRLRMVGPYPPAEEIRRRSRRDLRHSHSVRVSATRGAI